MLEEMAHSDESRDEQLSKAKRIVLDSHSPSGVGPHWTTAAWMDITHQTDNPPTGWGLARPKVYRDFQGGLLEEVGLPLAWFVLNCVGSQPAGVTEPEIVSRVRIAIIRVVKANHASLVGNSYPDLMSTEQLVKDTFHADEESLREWGQEAQPSLPKGTFGQCLVDVPEGFKSIIRRQLKQLDVKGLTFKDLGVGVWQIGSRWQSQNQWVPLFRA